MFTNEEPHNKWMTWITNDYFMPSEISTYVTTPVLIDDQNETNWRIEMQFIEPKLNAV